MFDPVFVQRSRPSWGVWVLVFRVGSWINYHMYKQGLKVEFGAKEGGSHQPFKLAGLEYGFLGISDFLGIVQFLERETKW